MRVIAGLGRFLWDFIIGEDWRIAAGVVIVVALGAFLTAGTAASDHLIAVIVAGGIIAVAVGSIAATALAAARRRG